MSELLSGIGFKGMSPATNDENLSVYQASLAVNVDLFKGQITPTKRDIPFAGTVNDFDPGTASSVKTRVFAFPGTGAGSFVVASSHYDHAAYAVNVNGELEAILAGPNGGFRFRRARSSAGVTIYDGTVYQDVTVPAPTLTLVPVDAGASATRYSTFRLAYVFSDGYETPMGGVSDEIGYVPGDSVSIAPIDLAPLPVAPVAIRIYMSVAGTNAVEWRYLGEFTDISYPTVIELLNDIAGEVMMEYDTVPADIRTVCAAPWGGFAFTTVSRPGVLQFTDGLEFRRVWTEYELNTGGTVTALLAGTSEVFALCDDGGPFVVSGTALDNLVLNKGTITTPLASTSAGAAVFNDTCLYVSAHGFVTVSSAGTVAPYSEESIFTADQWGALLPESMAVAFASDGSPVFASASASGKTGIIKPYGLVWKTGVRRSFAVLPHNKSLVYL